MIRESIKKVMIHVIEIVLLTSLAILVNFVIIPFFGFLGFRDIEGHSVSYLLYCDYYAAIIIELLLFYLPPILLVGLLIEGLGRLHGKNRPPEGFGYEVSVILTYAVIALLFIATFSQECFFYRGLEIRDRILYGKTISPMIVDSSGWIPDIVKKSYDLCKVTYTNDWTSSDRKATKIFEHLENEFPIFIGTIRGLPILKFTLFGYMIINILGLIFFTLMNKIHYS